jgi:NitT/TauT family transport system permease protein
MTLTSTPAELANASVAPPPLVASAQPNAKRSRSISRIIGPPIVLIAFVAFWQLMHEWGMRAIFDKPDFLVPSPVTVIDRSFVNSVARTDLLNGLKWTTFTAIVGLLITIVLGMGMGILMAQAKWAEGSFYPYLVALQATPVLAIVPIIVSVFGTGLQPRLFVCVMISFFPIVTNTLFGLKAADAGQHDLFTLRGASTWRRLWKLQLPAALPAIFTGFRISAGLSVIGAVVGEQFLEKYRQKSIYPQLWGGLLLAAALGIVVFIFFGWLNRRAVGHWHDDGRQPA